MRTLHSACLPNFNWRGKAFALLFLCVATAVVSSAQTFTTLHSFGLSDGALPDAGLVQATDGNLYGTTTAGGASGYGTMFKITPSGTLTTLLSFDDTDAVPSGLIQATDGNFYGTTVGGGTYGYGTVFKITPGGTLTALYSFCPTGHGDLCEDGLGPDGALVQAANGNFYGTTMQGGAGGACDMPQGGCGVVFEITPSGTLTTPYSFDGNDPAPIAPLVQATDGGLYGITFGGNGQNGTVYKITPSGALTTLYTFCTGVVCTDGQFPNAPLIQAANGDFYGTTSEGGADCIALGGCGTIFKVTPSGTETTLYTFCIQSGCPDGGRSGVGLIQATDGNFYGTTSEGGENGDGTIFSITPNGTLTTLHSFDGTDGDEAWTLIQDTNGKFYGTTRNGGANDSCFSCGIVFSLSVGLHPFVETQTSSDKVGAAVKILGTDLTSATGVSFNGTAAVFKVISGSLMTATVPTGATTGFVMVTTPSRSLRSNRKFTVRP